jgi:hypothetical protein
MPTRSACARAYFACYFISIQQYRSDCFAGICSWSGGLTKIIFGPISRIAGIFRRRFELGIT